MDVSIEREWSRTEVILFDVCIIFYLLFFVFDGPVWCVDSASYMSMNITREPLYPIFLSAARSISVIGVDERMVAVILQSILAGAVTWYLSYCIKNMMNSRLMQLLTILFQAAVSLLCRFAAARGSAYTDCIMTEGLGFSLFDLFVVQLYLFIRNNKGSMQFKGESSLFFTAFLLVSLRKQMAIVLIVIGVVFTWYYLIRSKTFKIWLELIFMTVMTLMAAGLFDRAYNYIVRSAWIEHSGNSMGILCTLLYSSDAERDVSLFEEGVVKELYVEIMEEADRKQLLYSYAEDGWLDLSSHYADSYDAIGYGIVNPVIGGYLSENYELDEVETALSYDALCEEMSRVLFHQKPLPFAKVYLCNTWKGFVNSIARANAFFSLYALMAYVGIVCLCSYLIRWVGKHDEGELPEQIKRSLCFVFIVMTSIVVNALVVGLFIFSQPRYMIYAMGLFYTAYAVLLYDVRKIRAHSTHPVGWRQHCFYGKSS